MAEPFDEKLQRMNRKMDKIKEFLQKSKRFKSAETTQQQAEDSPDSGIEIEPKKPVSQLGDEELQHLRARLRAQQKEKMSRPLLFQTADQKAQQENHISAIRQLFMYALEGGNAQGLKPTWCHLERWQKLSQVVIVCVENMSKTDFEQYSTRNPSLQQFLTVTSSFVSNGSPIAQSVFEYQVSKRRIVKSSKISENALIQAYKPYSDIPRPLLNPTSSGPACRLSLLLSVERMVMEKYPVPSISSEISHYLKTKEEYSPLTPQSPLYAIDCEMCLTTTNRNELTRISIVNENLQVVYDTYVKPFNPITNYLTKYSGITKAMLDPVKTRLFDVQNAVRKLLPPDAILCGQSLNGDLHALEMSHPYVIDTSVIFNLTGNPRAKSSLKVLSQVLLSKHIQGADKRGHDSVEDSRTTMELVLLKMKNGPDFGDTCAGWNPKDPGASRTESSETLNGTSETRPPSEAPQVFPIKRKNPEAETPVIPFEFTPDTPKNSVSFHQTLLSCAANAKKKYEVFGTSEYLGGLAQKDENVHLVDNNREALREAKGKLSEASFLVCELRLSADPEKKDKKMSSLLAKVWKLFSTAADRSLCALVLSGPGDQVCSNEGLCLAAVKNSVSMSFFNKEQKAADALDLD